MQKSDVAVAAPGFTGVAAEEDPRRRGAERKHERPQMPCRPNAGKNPDASLFLLCSFSAVSTPIFAIKYEFCSIFQSLQNYLAEFSNLARFRKK